MTRRLLVSNLILVTVVLLTLEIPLALVYGRHERDALNTALQRDASSLGALSEEIVEHPGDHDVVAVVNRFSTVGGKVVILGRTGVALTPGGPLGVDPSLMPALEAARRGHAGSGEVRGLAFVAVPVGAGADTHGAVLIARSDAPTDNRVHQFWLVLVLIGIGVLAVSVLVSRRLARWAVDPLKQLDDRAEELGRGGLHARAQTDAGPPEIVALALTFNEMADRLDDLVTTQRRFVADASHQLRTPLTALRLRLENLDSTDPTAVASTRDAALLETARLTRLVDGLLALARAEGRRLEREPVDVSSVVNARWEAWAPLAAEHGIDLRVDHARATGICASIVPGYLDQILDNLIDNALDATPRGRAVQLTAVASGSTIDVHVADEGRGMTDDERRRAFDPFWQNPGGHANGSAGLGLAIVNQLVRANGGTVELRPSPGGGVDAMVRIPRSSVDAETA